MSSFFLSQITSQKLELIISKNINNKKYILLLSFIFLLLVFGILTIYASYKEFLYKHEINLTFIAASCLGVAIISIDYKLLLNVLKFINHKNTSLIFDKNDDKIWVAGNIKSSKKEELFSSISEIKLVKIKIGMNKTNSDVDKYPNYFSVNFIKESGSSIFIYSDSLSDSSNQIEKEVFIEKLEQVKEVVKAINKFLSA